MSTHTSLHGVSDIRESTLSDCLQDNLAAFFSWGFLGIGAFTNYQIPSSGAYGGDFSRLRPMKDPYLVDGQAWQGARNDWVWETGVENSRQPIRVSGVFVDGVFQPATGVGPYAHRIDYPAGRVVFATGVSSSKTVKCEYSSRMVRFVPADAPWWREAQQGSYRPDDPHFSQVGSGLWSSLSKNRVQLPAVVVDALPETDAYGTALGGGQTVKQSVLFTVLAETPGEAKRIHDIIVRNSSNRTVLFNKDWVADERWPLDYRGNPTASGHMYPSMIAATGDGGAGWRQLRCLGFRSSSWNMEPGSPLQAVWVKGTYEVDLP